MKRLYYFPLLAALAFPNAINAEIDPKVAEFCLKAADFAGCVKAMEGQTNEPLKTTINLNKQNNLLFEIQALPEKIENTSLKKDLTTKTLSFLDTLADSNPEEVGENLYLNAKKLSSALDILYDTMSRKNLLKSGYGWNIEKNFATKNSLDSIFGGNTLEIKCTKRWNGIFAGGLKIRGQNIIKPVARVLANAAQQIYSPESVFVFPSNQEPAFVRSTAKNNCFGIPNAPVKEKKTEANNKPKKPIKINCDSPVWKNKP